MRCGLSLCPRYSPPGWWRLTESFHLLGVIAVLLEDANLGKPSFGGNWVPHRRVGAGINVRICLGMANFVSIAEHLKKEWTVQCI